LKPGGGRAEIFGLGGGKGSGGGTTIFKLGIFKTYREALEKSSGKNCEGRSLPLAGVRREALDPIQRGNGGGSKEAMLKKENSNGSRLLNPRRGTIVFADHRIGGWRRTNRREAPIAEGEHAQRGKNL